MICTSSKDSKKRFIKFPLNEIIDSGTDAIKTIFIITYALIKVGTCLKEL